MSRHPLVGVFFRLGLPGTSLLRRQAMIAALWLGLSCSVGAQQTGPTADAVKAAYLQKFVGFLDWPPSAFPSQATPLSVGVVGSDAVYAELLRQLAERPPQGRPVRVRRLTRPQQSADLHMLYLGHDAWPDVAAWAGSLRGQAVAMVTDAPNGPDVGALLTFVMVDERVRFVASLAAAERSGIRLSSRLLAVSERVVR